MLVYNAESHRIWLVSDAVNACAVPAAPHGCGSCKTAGLVSQAALKGPTELRHHTLWQSVVSAGQCAVLHAVSCARRCGISRKASAGMRTLSLHRTA